MGSSGVDSDKHDDDGPPREASIDALLDRAVQAINSGDQPVSLVAETSDEPDSAEGLEMLTVLPGDAGEIRRLTILYADLVDSTELSTRLEPERYRLLVGGYREIVRRSVERYEGHIPAAKGDGLLAVFGHPCAHEDDVSRAVQAGLDIARDVQELSEQSRRRFGTGGAVRVGVHRGLAYLDSPRTTFMAWRPMWRPGCAPSRSPGLWWFRTRSNR